MSQKAVDIFEYTITHPDEICKELGCDARQGLNEKEVHERMVRYGKNILASKKTIWPAILLRQFTSAFIYLLLALMAITLFLGQYLESAMIFLFLIINAFLGFYQEYRSERTMHFLRQYILSYVRVLRGQAKIVSAESLVQGDIIFLRTGDKVPADVRFLETDGVVIDESILTGESTPVYKIATALKEKPASYHEALNIGFSGSAMVKGNAKAIVVATGKSSAIGEITRLATETKRVSNFEKQIRGFSQFIFKLVGIILVVIFAANFFIKEQVHIVELLIFSIALTVSVIPEALPLVTTFSLSQSARRLTRNKIVVKRLSAVEDLGSIDVLCSDKTGTLTENKLEIKNIYALGDKEQALWYSALSTMFEQKEKLEPFDAAILKGLAADQLHRLWDYHKVKQVPFDPAIKRSISLVANQDNHDLVLVTIGAPEVVMGLCKNVTSRRKTEADQWASREGESGNRVLALAIKTFKTSKRGFLPIELEEEKGLTFLGILSFADSIKKTAYSIVSKAETLGISIKIITGDGPEVSGNVAFQIGLIDSPKKVISGEQWDNLDEKGKVTAMDYHQVFARFSPEQKYELVSKLQSLHEVGFLGEGINDAPALKISGLSLVVESGADISKEVADIVLLRKDLRTILDGVEEGRRAFANTVKYIRATLIGNFGNFFAIALTSLMVNFLPMLPLQILLVNLLSDFPMISVSTDNVDEKDLKKPRKYHVRDIAMFCIILGICSTVFDFLLFGIFYKISPEVLHTNWFIASVLTELALIFSIRTGSFFIKAKRPSVILVWLSLIVALVTIILPFTPFGQHFFKFTQPSLNHMIIILLLVAMYFVTTEILKLFYRKLYAKEEAG